MRGRTTKLAAVTAAVALTLAACGDDGNDEAESPATTEAEAEVGSIVDVAAGNEDLSILVTAVQEAGLVETLSGDGPFTVFAPTNDAFAALLEDLGITAEDLFADTELLTSVLTYHVLDGTVDAATAVSLDGQTAPTLNGAEIAISVMDGNVMINDATVTTPDVEATNGIVHIIDTVLLPPSDG